MRAKKHWCEKCGLHFYDKSTLNRHIKRKHNKSIAEPVLDCTKCEKKFSNEQELGVHFKLHHKKQVFEPRKRNRGFNSIVYTKSFKPPKNLDLLTCFNHYEEKIEEIIFEKLQFNSVKIRYTYKIQLNKYLPNGELEVDYFYATSSILAIHSIQEFPGLYSAGNEKILDQFTSFNQNGSGWIFDHGMTFYKDRYLNFS